MKAAIILASAIVLAVVQSGTAGHVRRVTRETDVMGQLTDAIVKLKHAQSRLSKFTDEIEAGLNSGVVQSTLGDKEDKFQRGQVDFFKLVKAFRENNARSFPDLIKEVADDTHILMDELYGRLDNLGTLVAQHEKADTSAEVHHSKA